MRLLSDNNNTLRRRYINPPASQVTGISTDCLSYTQRKRQSATFLAQPIKDSLTKGK